MVFHVVIFALECPLRSVCPSGAKHRAVASVVDSLVSLELATCQTLAPPSYETAMACPSRETAMARGRGQRRLSVCRKPVAESRISQRPAADATINLPSRANAMRCGKSEVTGLVVGAGAETLGTLASLGT